MYAVLGVSGNTGRGVADRLLANGHDVRVVVRNADRGEPWAGRGAEVALADLLDANALTAAFRGVEGAWVLLPPNPGSTGFVAEQRRKAEAIAKAANAAGVKHLALLSSVAAQYPAGTGPIVTLHHAEPLLAAAVPRLTLVRAAYFMENWGGSLSGVADGLFPTFLNPDVAVDMVATRDIARVGADALASGGVDGVQKIELASGKAPLSPRDVAAVVSKLVGKPLEVVWGPADAIVPTFTSYGLSADVAGLYREMITGFNAATGDAWERDGWFVRGPTTVEQVLAPMLRR